MFSAGLFMLAKKKKKQLGKNYILDEENYSKSIESVNNIVDTVAQENGNSKVYLMPYQSPLDTAFIEETR